MPNNQKHDASIARRSNIRFDVRKDYDNADKAAPNALSGVQ